MCEPTTLALASMGLAMGGTVLDYQGQRDLAKGQEKANKVQAEAARDAYRSNLDQTIVQQSQETAAASQQMLQQGNELRKAKATARVSAGEAGIAGLSVDDLLNDLDSQGLTNMNSIEANYVARSNDIGVQRRNAYINSASTINSLKIPMEPSLAKTGITLASQGLVGYQDYQRAKTL
jgi:hypothetical protein